MIRRTSILVVAIVVAFSAYCAYGSPQPRTLSNGNVTDDEKVAVWQDPKPDYRWEVRSGEMLAEKCSLADVSGNWIAVFAQGRAPWIANLDTPNKVAAELSDSPGLIASFSDKSAAHVFARRGWQNDEGPMKYYVFDFGRGDSKSIKEMTLPWARVAIDMDPQSGFAVLNDNGKSLGTILVAGLKDGETRKHPVWGLDRNCEQGCCSAVD